MEPTSWERKTAAWEALDSRGVAKLRPKKFTLWLTTESARWLAGSSAVGGRTHMAAASSELRNWPPLRQRSRFLRAVLAATMSDCPARVDVK